MGDRSIPRHRHSDYETASRVSNIFAEKPRTRRVSIYSASSNNLHERACRWVVNSRDPSWTQTTIIDALTSLSHLQDVCLTLHYGPFPLLQLFRLSGLKKISLTGSCINYRSNIIAGLAEAIAKSPELVYLEVNTATYVRSPEIPTLHDLFSKIPSGSLLRLTHLVLVGMFARIDSHTIPHLRSLVCLDLSHLYEPSPTDDSDQTRGCVSTITDIYATLNLEKIHPKHIVVNGIVNDIILDYLYSHSGLVALELCSIFSRSVGESKGLSHRFYMSVLARHVDSLQVLKINPRYEGGWCYNVDDVSQAVVLAQCNKLRSLSMSVTLNSASDIPPNQLTVDSPHGDPSYNGNNFDDMVGCGDYLTAFLYLPDHHGTRSHH